MAKRYRQIIVLTLALVFVAACTSAPTSIPSPTTVPPTPIVAGSAPTDPQPTVAPSATATSLPTMVSPTEEVGTNANQDHSDAMEANRMNIKIGDTVLTATLVENSSSDALKEILSEGPITLSMRDYGGMEKVGSLGMDLPRNDQQITTEAGDIILFQGSMFVIYYAPNSWNFTRLGKINNVTAEGLRDILGDGNVSITLSLPQE